METWDINSDLINWMDGRVREEQERYYGHQMHGPMEDRPYYDERVDDQNKIEDIQELIQLFGLERRPVSTLREVCKVMDEIDRVNLKSNVYYKKWYMLCFIYRSMMNGIMTFQGLPG